jgi:hypothetical protein
MKVRSDSVILGLSALGIAGCLWLLSSENGGPVRANNFNQGFGHVSPLGNDVRLRGESIKQWSNIETSTAVFQRDRVFTGENSSALISLKSDQDIVLAPNSLLLLNDKTEELGFELTQGSFSGVLKKGFTVRFKVDGVMRQITAKSDNTKFTTKTDKSKNFTVYINQGEASYSDQSSPAQVTIAESHIATIEKKNPADTNSAAPVVKVTQVPVQLLEPTPGAIVWKDGREISFSWNETNNKSTESKKYSLEISKTDDFAKIEDSKTTTSTQIKLKMRQAGTYFWRVKNLAAGDMISADSQFSVVDLKEPVADDFQTEFQVRASDTQPSSYASRNVQLRWHDYVPAHAYRVEISRNKSFSKLSYASEIRKSEAGHSTELNVSGVEEGLQYWRVISSYPGRADLTSAPARLEIRHKIIPEIIAEPPTLAAVPTPTPTPLPPPEEKAPEPLVAEATSAPAEAPEPEDATKVQVPSATKEPAFVVAKEPTRAPAVETSELKAPESILQSSSLTDLKPKSRAPGGLNLQAGFSSVSRTYSDAATSNSTLDFDLYGKASRNIFNRVSASVGASIALFDMKKLNTSGSTPRPINVRGELGYKLISEDLGSVDFDFTLGYSYWHTLGQSDLSQYRNVYAPIVGFNYARRLVRGYALLTSPRYGWVNSTSYEYEIPVGFLFNQDYQIQAIYSHLFLNNSMGTRNSFDSLGCGFLYNY